MTSPRTYDGPTRTSTVPAFPRGAARAVRLLLVPLVPAAVAALWAPASAAAPPSEAAVPATQEAGGRPDALRGPDALGASVRRVESEVVSRTLPNGLRVTVRRRGDAPVFAGVVAVRVGGVDEPPGSTGIAHLLEHMAFKGTPDVGTKNAAAEAPLLERQEELVAAGAGEDDPELRRVREELARLVDGEAFTRELEKRGATGLNATTDKEMTKYFVNLPTDAFAYWCWLESERMLRPVMRQFYQERDVVLEERRMRYVDDPGGKLYEMLLESAYDVHPYQNPVIGYAADVEKLTASRLEEFHRRYYTASNTAVSVVGGLDPARALETIEKYFGRLPSRPRPVRDLPAEPPRTEEARVGLEKDAAPLVYVGYHKPVWPDPNDPPVSLAEEVLAGGPASLLVEELVKKRRLATSVDVDEVPGIASPNLAFFVAVPRPGVDPAELLTAFDGVMERFAATGPEPYLLDAAKRRTAVDYLGQASSNMSLALQLATSDALFDDWRAHLRWFDAAMRVTADEVRGAAARYFIPSNRVVATVTSPAGSRRGGKR